MGPARQNNGLFSRFAFQKRGLFYRAARAIGAALSQFTAKPAAYNSTDPRRKLLEQLKTQRITANEALGGNLQTLVNQCRHLERNTPTARAVAEGFAADVIGTGIDVAPDTGSIPRDEKIRKVFLEWAEYAGVDGTTLWELQLQAAREIVSAGSMLWRFVIMPERLADGKIPLGIQSLEPEWLSAQPVATTAPGSVFCNGIELDKLGRPIAYHLADPNSVASGVATPGERVLAKFIAHGFEKRRPGQAHGEPILAPVVERLYQEEDLVKIELQAAKISAAFAVAVTSEFHEDTTSDETAVDGSADTVTDVSPGTVVRFSDGEKIQMLQSSRPNQQIAPFRDMLSKDVAAAARVSRKWLNRDYSSATFMNTRMEQADSKRMHKATQHWLGRHVASRPYVEALPWIMLHLGMVMPSEPAMRAKLAAHKILPDLPEYVDPLKDGQAATQNWFGNLTTLEDECSSRGKDWQKIAEQRKLELEKLNSLGLTIGEAMAAVEAAPEEEEAAPEEEDAPPKSKKPEAAPDTEKDDARSIRVVRDEAGRVLEVIKEVSAGRIVRDSTGQVVGVDRS